MKRIYRLIILMLGIPLIVSGGPPQSTDPITESNIRLIRGLWGAPLSADSIANYEDFIAEDIQIHGPHGEERSGLETIKAIDTVFITAFQELSTEVQDIFGSADRVVVYWKWRAVHVGAYEGIPASGKTVTLSGMVMYRIDDKGEISEVWAGWDNLGLCQQIANVTIEPLSLGEN